MDVNIKSLKDKSSKYQASSKLINDSTIWKSTSTQESYEPKKKKDKRAPTETEYLTIEKVKKVNSK